MKCKTCGYALWNLTGRTCPECGRAFAPSEFEFARNSVRFCCPHCMQAYYGTDAKGHLVPREFDCVSCGGRVEMDRTVLLPTEGVSEEQTRADYQPWLEVERLGFFRRWWETVIKSLGAPHRLMALTPPESSVVPALGFGVLSLMVYSLLGAGLPICAIAGMVAVTARGGGGFFSALVPMLIIPASIVAAHVVLLLLWGLATHGLLMITGARAHGLGRTMQAMSYGAGAYFLLAVPCLGPYLLAIFAVAWWMVSATIMVKVGQGVGGWRASFATLTPPIAVLAAGIGLAVWGAYLGSTFAPPPGAMVPPPPPASAPAMITSVRDALASWRSEHGAWPAHGLALVGDNGALMPEEIIIPGPGRDDTTVSVDGLSISDFFLKSTADQDAVVELIARRMGPGVIAHRAGDVVFTYHGIPDETTDPRLWLLVVCPARSDASFPPGLRRYTILEGGGPVELPEDAFPPALEAQNRIRAEHDLPPLPDPAAIDTFVGGP